jgi:hypothetical protein
VPIAVDWTPALGLVSTVTQGRTACKLSGPKHGYKQSVNTIAIGFYMFLFPVLKSW